MCTMTISNNKINKVSVNKPGNSVLDVIGNTPLVRVFHLAEPGAPNIYVKLEGGNPGGSCKDRSAREMIEGVEREHSLKPGARLILCTSGNMGVGMAMVCAVKQFRLYCLVDPKISPATEQCLRLYGAHVIKVYQRDET